MFFKLISKEADEPIESKEHCVNAKLPEMVCQLRQLLLKQVIKDLNFNLNSNHLGVEIYRQYRLDEESENPKGFFFSPQIFDKSTEYKIHALTISDHRIPF
jgi:hypothetical protein